MWITSIKTIIILSILCFLSSVKVQAQGVVAQGTVYENVKGNPLIGASIMLMNENNRIIGGTATDLDGKFKLLVPEGITKIAFSFIGLKTQEFAFVPNKVYEVILKPDNTQLEEVVVKAVRKPKADLGMLQKDRKDMSNAISSVDMKVLETQTVSSVDQLLQGAAPGLQVTFNSGDPGAGASLRIRGISSLEGNNNPLWVIDGAEMISTDFDVSSLSNIGSNPIADIDPSDIESIDILKDASSTAIYGSRGANGVIVIKTKRGRKGKPQFSFSAKLTGMAIPERIPLLNGDQQRMFVIEARANKNGGIDDVNDGNLKKLRGDLSLDDAWIYNNNTDMVDMLSRTGFLQNYNFSLRGGGDRLNYYWSLAYDTEYGTTKGGGFNRFTTMVNLDYTMSDKLKIGTKFQYANTLTDKRCWEWPIKGVGVIWNDININPLAFARKRAAFLPVYNQNGTAYYIEDAGQVSGTDNRPYSMLTKMYNPIAMIDKATYQERVNRFTAILSLNYTLNKYLSFFTQVSIDYRQNGNEFFAPSEALGIKAHHDAYNSGKRDDNYNMQLVNKNRIIFTPIDNEKHHVAITAIADLLYNTSESTSMSYNRSASPNLTESNSAPFIANAGGNASTEKTVSLVVDAHYRLLNRYNLNVSLKTEGSSKFGKDNPFSIFPTVGFAWNLNQEPFLKDKEWIELIKPRFSYGQTGKMPNIDALLSVTYGTGANGYNGKPYTYINKFAYDNLHEERTTEYNYGLDWSLWGGRFSGEANYYKRTTKDLLLKELTSTSIGFTERMTNFGTLENEGWELGFTFVPIDMQDARFKWSVYYSIARNRNKMIEMPEKYTEEGYTESLGYGGDYPFRTKLETGSVIGGFYGFKARGVYARDEDAVVRDFNGNLVYEADGTPKKLYYGNPQNGVYFKGGDMIYEDINHDGVINDQDVVQIGDANVGYYGMFRNNINWKQWALAVSFYYSLGQDVINGMRYDLENMNSENNQATSILRRWRKQGDVTDMPRAEDYCKRNYAGSTRWVEDASYLKLKEVSLTYNFNRNVLKKLRLSQLSIWGSGMNLFTWTKYKGIDPEIGLTSGNLVKVGIDKQNTAPSIHFTFGIRASF